MNASWPPCKDFSTYVMCGLTRAVGTDFASLRVWLSGHRYLPPVGKTPEGFEGGAERSGGLSNFLWPLFMGTTLPWGLPELASIGSPGPSLRRACRGSLPKHPLCLSGRQ